MIDSLLASAAAGEAPALLTVPAAAALAALLFATLRRRTPGWLLLIFGTLPFAAVWAASSCNRIYSGHGFLHISTLYQMLNGYYPPMNPLLWGMPQLYPWAHLVPVAALVSLLRMSPSIAHPVVNVVCACGALVLFYKAAAIVHADRGARVLAVMLSMFSLTVFNLGPFVTAIQSLTRYEPFDFRIVPTSNFTNWSGMPIGFVFHALFLHSLLRIFAVPRPRGSAYVLLAVAIAGASYGYPLIWPALIAEVGAIALLLLVFRGRQALTPVLRASAGVAAGSLLFLPYMLQLASVRSAPSWLLVSGRRTASFMLTTDPDLLVLKLTRVALFLLPIALLFVWKASKVRELWRSSPIVVLTLGGPVAVNVALYVLLTVTPPLSNEYKFLIYACFSLGLLAAGLLHAVYLEHRAVCFLLVWGFLLPPTHNWLACGIWTTCDRAIDEGADLRRQDPGQDELHAWIRTRTAPDAAFLDTTLDVPVFGQRQLFVGTGDWFQPGWTSSPHDVLSASSYDPDLVVARERLIEEIYWRTADRVREVTLDELRRMTGTSDVFVVARDELARRRMSATTGLHEAFANEAAAVYRLQKGDP